MVEEKNLKEEVLEYLWVLEEEGSARREDLLSCKYLDVTSALLDIMLKEGLLKEEEARITFAPKGAGRARHLIRSHRLAERLFTDILDIKRDEQIESNACSFEHILSDEVVTAICSILGHPRECPHGQPIPPGECCKQGIRAVEKVVYPLSELKAGEQGKVLYFSSRNHTRLDQLIVIGISPGSLIRVHQTLPAYVIQAGETSIALDKEICRDIYVRRMAKF